MVPSVAENDTGRPIRAVKLLAGTVVPEEF
jgi:hypothetical protein